MRVLLTLAVLLDLAAFESYKGYKLYDIAANKHNEKVFLTSFYNNQNFNFLSGVNNLQRPVQILVAPQEQKTFEDNLKSHNITFSVRVSDVESVVQAERTYYEDLTISSRRSYGLISFDRYYRHNEINAYLNQLAKKYPSIVTVINAGKSYENRSINAIRIGNKPDGTKKPVIFIDAGIHAREWIAPAMALYVINQLVENANNYNLIENIDWVILPSVNPDGYEFTWTEKRFWRKTRSPGVNCSGSDPNRNFNFHWSESGVSLSDCSDTYPGSKAFSEVEARVLRDLLASTNDIVAYLTLHSYGEYILYPWGYNSDLCDNWEELDKLGNDVKDAIQRVNGTIYSVGSSTRLLYAAAGASDDWAKSTGIKIVYTIELPRGGTMGFDLPAGRILPVVTETFDGIKLIHDYVKKNSGSLEKKLNFKMKISCIILLMFLNLFSTIKIN